MKKLLTLLVILVLTIIPIGNSYAFEEFSEFPKPDEDRNIIKVFPMSKITKDGSLSIDKIDRRYYKDIIQSLNLSEDTQKKVYLKTFSKMDFRTILGKNSKLPYRIHSIDLDLKTFLQKVGAFKDSGKDFGIVLIDNNLNAIKGLWKFEYPTEENEDGKVTFNLVKDKFDKVSLMEPVVIKDAIIKEEMTIEKFLNEYAYSQSLISNILFEIDKVKNQATFNYRPYAYSRVNFGQLLRLPDELRFSDLIYVFRPYFNSTNCGMIKSSGENFYINVEDDKQKTVGYRAWEFKKNGHMYTLILGF